MITYPVVQHESISFVSPPPDKSVATPVAPKMKTPEPPLPWESTVQATVSEIF